ncbi:MAG: DUF4268 domain-containing protein [Syntrophomonas sp.]
MQQLGKLNLDSNLREIWINEAYDFTPWLAENLDLLGAELGMDLELISTEYGVGTFSLDILARDTSNNNYVAIENQLEITDHNHLGQLITYASGVDAKTIIWITKEMKDEHRKALDWLNQISEDVINFFGIEIQLITIDDSRPAPFFKIKASPNEWSRNQRNNITAVPTDKQQYYHEFFNKLLARVHDELPNLTNKKEARYDNYMTFPTGKSGLQYSVEFRLGNRFACGLYIDTGDKFKNEEIFDALASKKTEIEAHLGELTWEKLENRKGSRIVLYRGMDEDNKLIEWALSQLKAFKYVFGTLLS